jgi:hypothetical protein
LVIIVKVHSGINHLIEEIKEIGMLEVKKQLSLNAEIILEKVSMEIISKLNIEFGLEDQVLNKNKLL